MEIVGLDNIRSIEENEKLLKHTDPNRFSSSDNIINEVLSIGPNEELLKAVESNNLVLFKHVLKSQPIDLNYVYSSTHSYTGTIIDICCKQMDKANFIRELLLWGVDVNYLSLNENKAPIHFAAESGCKDLLNVLLEEPKTDINILDDDGNSALHLATIAGFVECVSLLLNSNKDIKPNQINKQGETPAYLAAVSEHKNNKLIAEFIKCPKIYLSMIVQGRPLREIIEDNYPHITPFKYLYSKDTEGFIWHINSTNELDGYDGEYTYLQYACTFCLPKVVQALLDHKGDPNERIKEDDMYPVFIAAHKGFADVVRVFLNSNKSVIYQMNEGNTRKINNVIPHYTSVLHVLISGWANNSSKENIESCDYRKTFDLLLPICTELDINYTDSQGNTCLHYAAFLHNSDCIISLLDQGAYLGKKNNRGEPPLANISHDVLRSYLDKCVLTNKTFKIIINIECEIKCSYKFLCPPRVYDQNNKGSQKIIQADIPETYPLLYISKIPELRSLLLHPVLSNFLYLKWSKLKKFYFMYLMFYLACIALLTEYIMCSFEVQTVYTIYIYSGTMMFCIGLIICELFKFISCPLNYVITLENWIKIGITISTACLLSENLTTEIRVLLSVVALKLSWVEFIIILGIHPIFSVPLLMFKVVSKNFFKFLAWSFILISAFILNFYMLFKNENDMHRGFSKLIGEFNLNQFPFSIHFDNLLFVYIIICIMYVFFILIVLVNLLNGIAVSDTRKIQKDAEIVALVSRSKFVYSIETMLVRDVLSGINYSRIGRIIFSLLNGWSCIDLMIFPNALKNSEITIFPNKKNVISFGLSEKINYIGCMRYCRNNFFNNEIIDKDKKTIELFKENVNILVGEVKYIKQILHLKKQEMRDEDDMDVIIKTVKKFKNIINSVKNKENNEEKMNVIVKSVDEFKEMLNLEKSKEKNVDVL